jgi:hypothetical protein
MKPVISVMLLALAATTTGCSQRKYRACMIGQFTGVAWCGRAVSKAEAKAEARELGHVSWTLPRVYVEQVKGR